MQASSPATRLHRRAVELVSVRRGSSCVFLLPVSQSSHITRGSPEPCSVAVTVRRLQECFSGNSSEPTNAALSSCESGLWLLVLRCLQSTSSSCLLCVMLLGADVSLLSTFLYKRKIVLATRRHRNAR